MKYFQVPDGLSSSFTVRNARPCTEFSDGRIFTDAIIPGILNISVEVPAEWLAPAKMGDVKRLMAKLSGRSYVAAEGDDALVPGTYVLRLQNNGVLFADTVTLAVDTI